MILINREKAEVITWKRLISDRESVLASLDIQFLTALERGEDVSAIAVQKQALRDVTEKKLSGLSIADLSALTLDGALAL